MMFRKLAVSLAVAGILGASNANALGLGEIKINSALNEPLNAEIKLLQVRKLSPLQIQPRMADVDEFALAGLDKARFLNDVRFQVKVNPDGTGSIYITSDRPVKEPFLNFLVELNWPNGRLVREYTLLLDPPVFDPTPVRQTVQPSATPTPAPAPVSTPPKPVAVDNIRSRADGKQQIYVDVKDTLWSIALKHKPDNSVTARQVMIALQQKNPHAFVDNNINKLKAGVVLDMPTLEEIKALNNNQATKEVVRQTEQWKTGKAPQAPVEPEKKKPVATTEPEKKPEPAPVAEVPAEPAPKAEDKPSAELKIVTPKDTAPVEGETTDQTGETGPIDDEKKALIERNQELETRLSESLENTDKIARENEELNERMDSIQYELEKLREMLELKDKEMAVLQDKLSKAPAQPAPAPAPAPEKGLVDQIMGSPTILGGIGAALIALLGGLFFFLRKRKSDEEESTDSDSGLVQMPEDLDEVAAETEEAPAAEETPAEEDATEASDDTEFDTDDLNLDEEAAADDDLSDIDDLDLDMDMDLDLDLDEETVDDVVGKVEEADSTDEDLLQDDEFDLGLDEEEEDTTAVSDDLDSILDTAEPAEDADDADLSDDLDAILGDSDDIEDDSDEMPVDDELDAILDAGADEALEEVDDVTSDELDAILDDAGDLEDLDDLEMPEAMDAIAEPESLDELEDLGGDLDFAVAETAAEEVAEPVAAEEEGDLDFEVAAAEVSDQADSEDVAEDALDDLLGMNEEEDLKPAGLLQPETEEIDDLGVDLDLSEDEPEPSELVEAPSEEDELDLDLGIDDFDPTEEEVDMSEMAEEEEAVEEVAEEAVAEPEPEPVDDELDALLDEVGADLDDEGADEAPDLEDILSDQETPDIVKATEVDLDLDKDLGTDEPVGSDEPKVREDVVVEGHSAVEDMLNEANTSIALDEAKANSMDSVGDLEVQSPEDIEPEESDADLDAMLDEIGMDLEETDLTEESGSSAAEAELEDVIGHDLDTDLDSDLDALLNSADDDIELDESDDDQSLEEDFDELAGLNLLEGADEVETKLDLARAYMDMEDLEGARDILQEIAAEGNDEQKKEAEALIRSINEK